MQKRHRVLGLIPARGGSKGLPGKNLKSLCGKPLIAWTIQQALASRHIDKVLVSTDSEDIAFVSKQAGAEVPFLRPKELATDESKVLDTVLHALEQLERQGETYDYVALLEPTSPLRKPDDIDKAIAAMLDNAHRADCLVSVGEIALEHPAYAKKLDGEGYVVPYGAAKPGAAVRQSLPRTYFPYGVIYLAKVSSLRENQAVYGGRIVPYVIERWQNYEINDGVDFLCVESILSSRIGMS